jgi:hypothetical protein
MFEHSHAYEKFDGEHDCSAFLAHGYRMCIKNISGYTLEFGENGIKVAHGESIAACIDFKNIQKAVNAKKAIVHRCVEKVEAFVFEHMVTPANNEVEVLEEAKEKPNKKFKSKSEEAEVEKSLEVEPLEETFPTVAPIQQEPSVQLSSTEANTDTEQN